MLAILSRSRSLRGGGHGSAASAGSGTASVGGPAGAPSSSSSLSSSSTNTSSTAKNHAGGQGQTHGPNAPLSLLSTMVVPSAAPAFVLPKAESASASASASTSFSTSSFSSSASSVSSSSVSSSSNTAASSISTSSVEPGLVSKPTLQTSTVLGLVEDKPSPPSPGINGKRECPYVNRPLPPPPPPKNPSTMPSRPSTSAGVGSKRTAGPAAAVGTLAPPSSAADFNRRISRDDMFLGTQTKKTAAFDKRISRDDLYLGTRPLGARSAAFHIPLRAPLATTEEGLDQSMAPPPPAFPARMATPESLMSGEIQIGMALGSPVRPSPPEPLSFRQQQQMQQERLQQVEPATYASWQPAAATTSHDAANTVPATTSDMPMQRSKTTRRKLFGIFGSKRHHDPVKSSLLSSSSAYSLEGSDSSSVVMTAAVPTSGPPASSSTSSERPATRSGSRKYQPIVIQIQPEPATTTNIKASGASPSPPLAPPAAPAAPSVKEGRSMRPFLRSKASEPAIRRRPEISNPIPMFLGNRTMSNLNAINTMGNGSNLMPPPMLGASPYLDVEIPDVRMERYSVMFGNVLGGGSSWQPASSLLARRQATLDKLKTINDRMQQEDLERDRAAVAAADAFVNVHGAPSGGLQRRATSPHVAKSPAFSLFPNKSPNVVNAVGTSPLSPRIRSNTSPAATRSPARPGVDYLQPQVMARPPVQQSQRYINPLRENPPVASRRGPTTAQTMPVTSMPAPVPAPAPAPAPAARPTVHFDPSQSNLILDSPTEMDYPEEGAWQAKPQQVQPFKPVIQEPQWQMISPPSTGSLSSAGSSGSATSNLLRGRAAGPGPGAVTPSPSSTASVELDVDESDTALKSAVEISIARQISISRQQRQLLRPLKTNMLAPPPAAAAASTTPSSSTSSPSRSATLKLSRNERLQETKTSTPTLVVSADAEANYKYSGSSSSSSSGNKPRPPPSSSASSSGLSQAEGQPQQQRMRYISPRSNANANSSLHAYQMAQNRKSERVVLEAA